MPRATHQFPFEVKVLGFAARLSETLTGEARRFVIVFTEEGTAQTLTFEKAGTLVHDLLAEFNAAGRSYLFYDPFDLPEYCYLAWHNIDRSTMGRLIGEAFQDADFI